MFNQKGFSKVAVIIIVLILIGVFFYLFSISKFNKEYNCIVMGNAYVGPGGYAKAPLDCQSFIDYIFFSERDFPMY